MDDADERDLNEYGEAFDGTPEASTPSADAADAAEGNEAGHGDSPASDSATGRGDDRCDSSGLDSESGGGSCDSGHDIAQLKAELEEARDRAVRLYADFENFRRRTAKERLESYRNAEADILGGILPVVDNFERALERAGDDPFSEGVKMVYGGLMDFLKKRGVEQIQALDKDFDPAVHEAVAYQPSPDKPEGTIIYETRRGYRMADKVIRPASVIVSSGAPASN